ncbi:MAG: hypothetical protein IJL91_04445 [Bacteroidales bacterium]|jgi:tetratricopeptide (TPR) repeat protein|nr:hypothetical protein [Bacteroidales bacterium]
MNDYINLKALNLNELVGVVNLYPWYGAARKELCSRMAQLGGDAWGIEQYSDSAMYVGNRASILDLVREKSADYQDKDLEKLLKSYINEKDQEEESGRQVRVVGGDFFTQAQYDKVRREEDNVFSRFASKSKGTKEIAQDDMLGDEFCTETLAQIYLDQGYYEQARHIYSRLLLKFPEKNTYFAALIQKLDEQVEA